MTPSPGLRVLFVSHDALRGGATIFLRDMMRWFIERKALDAAVMLRSPGEMVSDFESLAPTWAAGSPPPPDRQPRDWLGRRQANVWSPQQALADALDRFDPQVVYLNTLTHGDLVDLPALRSGRHGPRKVISHVHELRYGIEKFGRGKAAEQLAASDHVITVSDAVSRAVRDVMLDTPRPITRIHGFTAAATAGNRTAHGSREDLLTPLGIPGDAWIIGMCGYADARKGVDLLVPLMKLLPPELGGRPLHAVWIGPFGPDYPRTLAEVDVRGAGLLGRVHFPGKTTHPGDWLATLDLHILLSREDSFPLVVLEAAALGVPTVCFAGGGGAPEFIRDDAGACVPHLDLVAMASTIVALLSDEKARETLGATARERVRRHHSADAVLTQILSVIRPSAPSGAP